METTKRIIWTNDIDIEDYRDSYNELYPDMEFTDDTLYDWAYEDNMFQLDCEKSNLDKELGNNLVIIANLGLWYGRRNGWKVLKGTNLNDIFEGTKGDYITWYVEDGEVKCDDIHHDGTNHYTYRVLKDGVDRFEFEEAMYDGEDIDKYTVKLGKYVAEVYGW